MPKKSSVPAEEKAENVVKNDKTDYSGLIKQVQSEYQVALDHIRPKWQKWSERLQLYNNQKRDKTAVGDPLLFTIHQTVLAALYDDRLSVGFSGRNEGDEDVEENLNALAEYDYEDMEKDIVDYDWDWDTTFFGRGVLLLMEYDRDTHTPVPEVIDPMTFLRDPKATSINGDRRGRGAARFFGREIRMTKGEMKERQVFMNLGQIKSGYAKSEIDQNRVLREQAQGLNPSDADTRLTGDNVDYRILEWFTSWNGKRVLVGLANDRQLVVRYQELEDDCWPAVDRALYPISHDWDGVCIPDLVEDKQRARARMINQGLKMAEAQLYPRYMYDSTKITNQKQLQLGENKYIPVEGNANGVISVVPSAQINADVGWVMQVLDTGAQKATATPDIQQGATSAQRPTATEIGIVAQKVDTRYSLSAKIFGWSEKRFWQQWYRLYKKYFVKDIDQKVIRIVGSGGPKWRTLTPENITLDIDPDISIESRVLSEQKRVQNLQAFTNFAKMAAAEQGVNRRYLLKHLGKLSGLRRDEIDMAIPKTVDELQAENENELLSDNKTTKIRVEDDHQTHIMVHEKAADTAARAAHIKGHTVAMSIKKANPTLVAPSPTETAVPGSAQPSTPMPSTAPGPAGAPPMPQLG